MRLKATLRAIIWCGAALVLTVSTSASATSSPTPSAAAQSGYVNAVHSNDPEETAIPSSTIVTLGEAVCNLFANGKSLNYVYGQLSAVSNGKILPAKFVSAVLTEAPMYLCLKYLSKVLTLRPRSAAPAPLLAPGSAAQKAFVKAVDSDGPTGGLSEKSLIDLGEGVCSLLQVHNLSYTLKTVTGTGKEYLPPRFVATLMKESPKYFCPQYVSKAEGAGSAQPPSAKSALAALLPSGVTHCDSPMTSSEQLPTKMAGLIASAACLIPKLGATSYAYGYEFDNASDYATSLNDLNTYEGFVPTSPSVGCPTSNSSDEGANQWGNSAFPSTSGQILECTMESEDKGPNNVPAYIWTIPTKNVILEATGDPGSTMQSLDAWWSSESP